MLTLQSPAKINLFLRILQQRADGYHDLQTHFQFLNVTDTLTFELNPAGEITSQSQIAGVAWQDNLIYKAAKLLQDTLRTPFGADISWHKALPLGGGLGGGSSNAATTLLALHHLWQGQLSLEALMQLGRQLGADVPIFIYGHAALAEGVGDKLSPLPTREQDCVLVFPDAHCSTPKLFSHPELTKHTTSLRMDTVLKETGNDFEPLVKRLFPEVALALDCLTQFSPTARLSGSGAACFALFDSHAEARYLVSRLPDCLKAHVCRTANVSPLVTQLQALGVHFTEWGVAKRYGTGF